MALSLSTWPLWLSANSGVPSLRPSATPAVSALLMLDALALSSCAQPPWVLSLSGYRAPICSIFISLAYLGRGHAPSFFCLFIFLHVVNYCSHFSRGVWYSCQWYHPVYAQSSTLMLVLLGHCSALAPIHYGTGPLWRSSYLLGGRDVL